MGRLDWDDLDDDEKNDFMDACGATPEDEDLIAEMYEDGELEDMP